MYYGVVDGDHHLDDIQSTCTPINFYVHSLAPGRSNLAKLIESTVQ